MVSAGIGLLFISAISAAGTRSMAAGSEVFEVVRKISRWPIIMTAAVGAFLLVLGVIVGLVGLISG